MSKSFKDLNSLFNHLEKEIRESIQQKDSNTAEFTKKVAGDNVQKHVYDVYEPTVYKRTGELRDNWEAYPTKKGIEVVSERYDEEKYVSEIVHTGRGYTYDFPYAGIPRPFADEAVKELRTIKNKELKEAVKQDMKRNRLNVK